VSLLAKDEGVKNVGSEDLRAAHDKLKSLKIDGRNYFEDLMENLLLLDNLSATSEEARTAKKVQVKETQTLLDKVETAQTRVSKMLKEVEVKLPAEPAPPSDQTEQYAAQTSKPEVVYAVPTENELRKLRLDIEFEMRELRDSYVLRASVPGMVKNDIGLEVTPDGGHQVLVVSGFRGLSPADTRAMQRDVGRGISQEQLLRRCLGRFGSFRNHFELPADGNEDNITASYQRGVLEIKIPRRRQAPTEQLFPPSGGYSRLPGSARQHNRSHVGRPFGPYGEVPGGFMHDKDFWW